MTDREVLLKELLEELNQKVLLMGEVETIKAPDTDGKMVKWVPEERYINSRLAYKAVEGLYHHQIKLRMELENRK